MKSSLDPLLFSKYKVLSDLKFCIVIPVKNEEEYVYESLGAFAHQQDISGDLLNVNLFEILILVNNCSDKSAALIREFQNENPKLNIFLEEISLPANQANIGFVRKNLFQIAYDRLLKNGGGVILTTDADTIVSENWIAQNYLEINNGADAVGGRILLSPSEIENLDKSAYTHHLKDEKYQLLIAELETIILRNIDDPLPRHHQHFNGSFAITAECFSKSGGVPDVTHLEDIALYERLNLIDAKVRHSNNVVVYTSSRCIGRSEIGLSHQLNLWKNMGTDGSKYYVESTESIIEKFTVKRKLIDLWQNKDASIQGFISQMHKINPEFMLGEEDYFEFRDTTYFGEWFSFLLYKFENLLKHRPPELVDDAILKLELAVRNYADSGFFQTSMR